MSAASVQWQVVAKNGATDPAAWQTAAGFEAWRFGLDSAAFGNGPHTIVARGVHGGVQLARQTAAVRFRQSVRPEEPLSDLGERPRLRRPAQRQSLGAGPARR